MSKIHPGDIFGRLTVINKATRPSHLKNRNLYWSCQCECGKMKNIISVSLTNGTTQSCGCLARELASKRSATTRNTPLTSRHKDVIEGCLLGDGCVRARVRTSAFQYCSIYKECVQELINELPFSFYSNVCEAKTKIINGKICNQKESYYIQTKTDCALDLYRKRWYVNNIKIVPQDLQITPTVLRWWFYGDGYSSYKNGKSLVKVGFSTQNFSIKDCEVLCQKIYEACGINFKRQKNGSIELRTTSQVKMFFKYIGNDNVLECFKYKWKFPESNINWWNNNEDVILISNYNNMKLKELQLILPGRSRSAIKSRARLLNIKY